MGQFSFPNLQICVYSKFNFINPKCLRDKYSPKPSLVHLENKFIKGYTQNKIYRTILELGVFFFYSGRKKISHYPGVGIGQVTGRITKGHKKTWRWWICSQS